MFIGRERELASLKASFSIKKPNITVVYGRRRAGKSFLIQQAARGYSFYSFEGLENLPVSKQKRSFIEQLASYGVKTALDNNASWYEILCLLKELINKTEITVILLDELQWLANYRAELISNLKLVLEQVLSKHHNLKLVLCGSIASFMINKVIKSRALYGRCDLTIQLEPFKLSESRKLLANKSTDETLLAHLLVGGIPKYLDLLTDKDSVLSSLAFHCANTNRYFANEYAKVFVSHFGKNPRYEQILRFLNGRNYGSSRSELIANLEMNNSGELTEMIANLESAGFIRSFVPFDQKMSSFTKRFMLVDHFISFYLSFIEPLILTKELDRIDFFNQVFNTAKMHSWLGRSFELLCYNHVEQIAQLLGFPSVRYQAGPYFRHNKRGELSGMQLDLVFKRADKVITVCEAKYQKTKVGIEVGKKLEEAISELPEIRKNSIQKVLITNADVAESLKNEMWFARILSANDLM